MISYYIYHYAEAANSGQKHTVQHNTAQSSQIKNSLLSLTDLPRGRATGNRRAWQIAQLMTSSSVAVSLTNTCPGRHTPSRCR